MPVGIMPSEDGKTQPKEQPSKRKSSTKQKPKVKKKTKQPKAAPVAEKTQKGTAVDVVKKPKKKQLPPESTEYEKKVAELKAIAIAAGEVVYNYKLVARSIGKDEDTLANWRKSDNEFSDKLEEARVRFLEKHIKVAKPEFLLERLEPGVFKERKEVKHTGLDRSLSEEELDAIIERANRSKASKNTEAA